MNARTPTRPAASRRLCFPFAGPRTLLLVFVVIAASLAVGGLAPLGPGTACARGMVGEPAANFTLYDTAGIQHTLSAEDAGHVVMLFMMGYA
jgi:hypothetical protein